MQRLAGEAPVPLLELHQGTKIYGGRAVLQEVSLTVEEGTATALLGRNGSGKSTLLSILAGLIQLSSGRLVRSHPGPSIGYAPETFPGLKLTPEQYLRSMGRISGLARAETESRMTELLEAFHLEQFRGQPMLSFSKGMLQKVNLIQSLLAQPELLLLDEPMSGLDLPAMDKLAELLLKLKQAGTAIVFSVHEPQWLEVLADQVHMLQAGRTVKTIEGAEHLREKPSTYIICSGLTTQAGAEAAESSGFIAWDAAEHESGSGYLGLTVETAYSDEFLRLLLEAGSSIVSVQRLGGWTGLELWAGPGSTKGEFVK